MTLKRSLTSKPGVPVSTTNADIPFAPGDSPVFANTTYWSANPPLEMSVFSPFKI